MSHASVGRKRERKVYTPDNAPEILRDGESIRVSMQDATPPSFGRLANDGPLVITTSANVAFDDGFSAHRPGFRVADTDRKAEEAYDAYVKEMTDAWRPKDAVAWQTGPQNEINATTRPMPTAAVSMSGKFPLSAVGQHCDLNGVPGVVKADGTGWAVCMVDPIRPSRAGNTNGDGTRDAVDAAWLAMVEEQQNAWRG